MKHEQNQTILGGVIEWKHDPSDPNEEPVVLGLKHNEIMFSDEWIGWGMGPGNVGIYGGNETGWQRFAGISGNYLTKMSYILKEEDGSVHYYNATSEEGILNPLIPSGIIENGKHPYNIQMTNYEFTKDRVKIDFTLDVPTRADGTPEANYYLNSINAPGGSIKCCDSYDKNGNLVEALYKTNPEMVPVYEESEWVGGHKTIHIEVSRDYYGTGRYKYWFYVDSSTAQEGDRSFGTIAAWRMLYPDLTSKNVYIKDNKLVVDSEMFTLEDYLKNPYQQIEIRGNKGTEEIWATGDANTNTTLFLGTNKQDGTPVAGLFNEDGSFNMEGQKYSYNRRTGVETVTPLFPNGAEESYEVLLYSGGFPIVKGVIDNRKDQEIKVNKTTINKKFGDKPFTIPAKAEGAISYKSGNTNVATVDKNGKVTIKAAGTAVITITAAKTDDYNAAETKVTVKVAKIAPTIKATTKLTVKAKKLKKKAQTVAMKPSVNSKGKITCTKKSGNKKITVTKAGKIKVKKGLKNGTYKVKVLVKAAAKGNYTAGSKTFTVKVIVK